MRDGVFWGLGRVRFPFWQQFSCMLVLQPFCKVFSTLTFSLLPCLSGEAALRNSLVFMAIVVSIRSRSGVWTGCSSRRTWAALFSLLYLILSVSSERPSIKCFPGDLAWHSYWPTSISNCPGLSQRVCANYIRELVEPVQRLGEVYSQSPSSLQGDTNEAFSLVDSYSLT